MAPASCRTLIAQQRNVRIAGRLSFVISIEIAPAGTNPCIPPSYRAAFPDRRVCGFSTCSADLCKTAALRSHEVNGREFTK
jgi:hypothetical protein